MTINLHGKGVIVTGAASGIGLSIARCFARFGAEVHVCDVDINAVASLNDLAEGIVAHQANVGDEAEVRDFLSSAGAALTNIDVLVNNVGIAGPRAPVEDTAFADWKETMRCNVDGMFLAIKLVVPEMKAIGSGAIINISSAGTITLPPKRSAYNTSKAAVEGLTRSLARELGPHNIRCNAILPGVVNNLRMMQVMQSRADDEHRSLEDIQKEYLQGASMGRLVEERDIGNCAAFLASDLGEKITGQTLAVCGGLLWEN